MVGIVHCFELELCPRYIETFEYKNLWEVFPQVFDISSYDNQIGRFDFELPSLCNKRKERGQLPKKNFAESRYLTKNWRLVILSCSRKTVSLLILTHPSTHPHDTAPKLKRWRGGYSTPKLSYKENNGVEIENEMHKGKKEQCLCSSGQLWKLFYIDLASPTYSMTSTNTRKVLLVWVSQNKAWANHKLCKTAVNKTEWEPVEMWHSAQSQAKIFFWSIINWNTDKTYLRKKLVVVTCTW